MWHAWPVSVNASGTDFLLPAENAPNAQPTYLLIRPDEIQDWNAVTRNLLRPGFVGDQLAQVVTLFAESGPEFTYEVQLDGQAVYTGTAQIEGAYEPLRTAGSGKFLMVTIATTGHSSSGIPTSK